MASQKRTNLKKQDEVESKHRSKQQEPESSFDQFYDWDVGDFSLSETQFIPRMDEHAELLAMSPSDEASANLVLQLQQTYGNRYVQRLLNSKMVQAKLTVNAPGDIYEQEAERIADEVISAEKSQVQRQEEEEEEEEEVQAQRQEEEEEELQAQRQPAEEEEEEQVQAQSAEGQPDTVSENIEARINNARGSGHPLSENVREPMEQAFEADFSDVRVHNDSEANLLNEQLSARAFTTARDIFFRQGEYSPGSDNGRRLIAHELTHVVQQNGAMLRRRTIGAVPTGYIQRGLKGWLQSLWRWLKRKFGGGQAPAQAPPQNTVRNIIGQRVLAAHGAAPNADNIFDEMIGYLHENSWKWQPGSNGLKGFNLPPVQNASDCHGYAEAFASLLKDADIDGKVEGISYGFITRELPGVHTLDPDFKGNIENTNRFRFANHWWVNSGGTKYDPAMNNRTVDPSTYEDYKQSKGDENHLESIKDDSTVYLTDTGQLTGFGWPVWSMTNQRPEKWPL